KRPRGRLLLATPNATPPVHARGREPRETDRLRRVVRRRRATCARRTRLGPTGPESPRRPRRSPRGEERSRLASRARPPRATRRSRRSPTGQATRPSSSRVAHPRSGSDSAWPVRRSRSLLKACLTKDARRGLGLQVVGALARHGHPPRFRRVLQLPVASTRVPDVRERVREEVAV